MMSQDENWTGRAERLDRLIRDGQLDAAKQDLMELIPSNIPRAFAVQFARLARRTRLNHLTLRILKPIIEVEKALRLMTNEEELALFAGALIRLGNRKQGQRILAKVNPLKNPDVLLYQVDGLFSEWNYIKAIPLLEKYLSLDSISEYQHRVGRLNLAAALGFVGNYKDAKVILEKLRGECTSLGNKMLLANILELSAQISLELRDFGQAERDLASAKDVLQGRGGLYDFFARKWTAIGELFKAPDSPTALRELSAVRTMARDLKDWEGIRQLDLYQSILTQNVDLFSYVVAGTPYTNYRIGARQKFSTAAPLPQIYCRRFHVKSNLNIPVLHLPSGKFGDEQLSPGSLPHRLLILLGTDFYRPFPLGEIFSDLYENEYYDPDTSPDRVRSVIKALVQWLGDKGVPLEVKTEEQAVYFDPVGPIEIQSSTLMTEVSRENYRLEELKVKVSGRGFTAREAAEILNMSLRNVQRLLSVFVEQGLLERIGAARASRYRVV